MFNDFASLHPQIAILRVGIDRAISNGCTELRKEEILEFLELVETATFVFIKVETKGSVRQYFMLLYDTIKVGHIQKKN